MKPKERSGVSIAMKATLALALALAAVLVWYLRRGDDDHAAAAPVTAMAAAGSGSAEAASPAKPKPNDRVKKVTPAERAALAKQILDARAGRAGRAAPSAPAGPSLPTPAPALPAAPPALDPKDLESFTTTFRDAMKEVVPYLADCYDKHSARLPAEIKVRANLTLTGDPDVGTLIDNNGLSQPDGAPLDDQFQTCLGDALAGLALPPLAEGEEVKVVYPFLFTR